MRIALGSDHAGFGLKTSIGTWLRDTGYDVTDVGANDRTRVHYPEYGAAAAREVAEGRADFGIVVCGSGQGICMSANKIPGIRAGVVRVEADAVMIRRHNDANVACFGEQATTVEEAIAALQAFLSTPFDGGRHQTRINQMLALDVNGRDITSR